MKYYQTVLGETGIPMCIPDETPEAFSETIPGEFQAGMTGTNSWENL